MTAHPDLFIIANNMTTPHDNDDELIQLLQSDKSPVARAVGKILLRQQRMDEVIYSDEHSKRIGLIDQVDKLKKGYTYLTIAIALSAGLGAAASHSFILSALKLLIP